MRSWTGVASSVAKFQVGRTGSKQESHAVATARYERAAGSWHGRSGTIGTTGTATGWVLTTGWQGTASSCQGEMGAMRTTSTSAGGPVPADGTGSAMADASGGPQGLQERDQ